MAYTHSFSLIFTYKYVNILIYTSNKNKFIACNVYIVFNFVLMNKIYTVLEDDRFIRCRRWEGKDHFSDISYWKFRENYTKGEEKLNVF